MAARILEGRTLAAQIRQRLKGELAELRHTTGRAPTLAFLLHTEEESSRSYAASLERLATELGVEFRLLGPSPSNPSAWLEDRLRGLAADSSVHGLLVQSPLPPAMELHRFAQAMPPDKDLDGLHPANLGLLLAGQPSFVPATAMAGLRLLRYYDVPLKGAHAVIVGRSNAVGKPLAALLLRENATLTICHTQTRDLGAHTRQADVLLVAAGKPQLITTNMVRPGAVVVDFGTNYEQGKLVGDVDFENVLQVCSAITPVPGGVGPVTNAVLMENLAKAFREKAG